MEPVKFRFENGVKSKSRVMYLWYHRSMGDPRCSTTVKARYSLLMPHSLASKRDRATALFACRRTRQHARRSARRTWRFSLCCPFCCTCVGFDLTFVCAYGSTRACCARRTKRSSPLFLPFLSWFAVFPFALCTRQHAHRTCAAHTVRCFF